MAKSSENPPPPATHAFSSPTTDLVTKSVPPTAVMYGDAAGKSGLNRLRKKARVRQRESRNHPRRGRDSLLEEPAALAPADALVARREEDGEAARARLHEGGVRRLHVLGRHLLLLVVAVRDRMDLTQKTRCAQRKQDTRRRTTEWTRGGFSSDEICLAQARSEYCELYTTVSGT